MNIERLRRAVRTVSDFPIKGIEFVDVTPFFKDPSILRDLADGLYEIYKDKGITKVVGIESRGFVIGALLADRLQAGFIPIRKPGKLPAATLEECYKKEYGVDAIQIHQDALSENDIILLHDDLLATGGTMSASVRLIQKFHPKKIYINCLIELVRLKGRLLFDPCIDIKSVLKLDL